MAARKPKEQQERPDIADRDEVLRLLTSAARKGHVGAMRLLLAELRLDSEDVAEDAGEDFLDELAERRAALGS